MKKCTDVYTTITIVHSSIILGGLSVSSLGIFFEHPYLAYFWYLALIGIAMMILTSIVLGIMLLLCRMMQPSPSHGDATKGNDLFTRPKSVRV